MDVFRTELLQSCFSADARQRGLPPPPLQFSDDEARELVEAFIRGDAPVKQRRRTAAPKSPSPVDPKPV